MIFQLRAQAPKSACRQNANFPRFVLVLVPALSPEKCLPTKCKIFTVCFDFDLGTRAPKSVCRRNAIFPRCSSAEKCLLTKCKIPVVCFDFCRRATASKSVYRHNASKSAFILILAVQWRKVHFCLAYVMIHQILHRFYQSI